MRIISTRIFFQVFWRENFFPQKALNHEISTFQSPILTLESSLWLKIFSVKSALHPFCTSEQIVFITWIAVLFDTCLVCLKHQRYSPLSLQTNEDKTWIETLALSSDNNLVLGSCRHVFFKVRRVKFSIKIFIYCVT